jgi:4-amino-4-deoxy-L-arabinose transferase-like glycosyltransferase
MGSHPQLKRWLDPGGIRAAILLALLAAIGNGIWILHDHSIPSWDQSHYLDVTWQYRQALSNLGPIQLLQAIHSVDPSRGPLFPVLMLPFNYVFGSGARSGLILNFCLAPVLYLAAGEIAAIVFRSGRARLIAILLTATVPLLVGLYHNVLQDFLLTTLATVSILLLLKTELFTRRKACLALGATVGLGMLAKVTFPLFLLGPLVVIAIQAIPELLARHRQDPDGGTLKRVGLNVGLSAGLALLLILPWYVSNFAATLDYVKWTTEPGLGVGPEDPYKLEAVYAFTAGLMNGDVSWLLGLIGLVSLALCIPSILVWRRLRPLPTETLFGVLILFGWILVPFLSVALAHNQDVRLIAPAMPALPIMIAGAMAAIRWRWVRVAIVTASALALIYQTANRTTELHPDSLPEDVTVGLGSQLAVIPLKSQTIGYERLPEPDYGTPIIEYIEDAIGGREQAAAGPPRTVCMLESEPLVNTNTFSFLAHSRGDQFSFIDIFMGPGGRTELARNLKGCEYALYVRQPRIQADPRLAVVNAQVAAQYMTPRTIGLFKGPTKTFYTGQAEATKGKSKYLDVAGSGAYVRVLVRDRIAK